MADEKITDMASATGFNDADVFPLVQSGVNKKGAWSVFKSVLKTYFDTIYSTIASPTFTGTVTTPAIIVSSETASRVAIIDGSKNVKSADTATYPSLTELAYVNGVTSAIQTQIDAKQGKIVEVTGNITAANDTNYVQTASATYTDPTPAEGKGYIIFVRNGTATVGGTAYPTQGTIIYRFYHSGAWVTNTMHHDFITLGLSAASFNPADSTTYYMSDTPTLPPGATATSRKLKLPVPSVLVAARIETIVAGTLAAGDESTTISLRLNNTTDSTISSAVKFTTVAQTLMITGLNISVATTDDFQLKVVTPAFSTNPTTCYISTTLFFQQL